MFAVFSKSLNKQLSYVIRDSAEVISVIFWAITSSSAKSLDQHSEYMTKEMWELFERIVADNLKAYLKATCEASSSRPSTLPSPTPGAAPLTFTPREIPAEGCTSHLAATLPFELMPTLRAYVCAHLLRNATCVDVVDKFSANYFLANALAAYYVLKMQFVINSLDDAYPLGTGENLAEKTKLLDNAFDSLKRHFFKGDECLRNIHIMAQLKVMMLCKDYFRPVKKKEEHMKTLYSIMAKVRSHECFTLAHEVWEAFFQSEVLDIAFVYILDYKKDCISVVVEPDEKGVVKVSKVVMEHVNAGGKEHKIQLLHYGSNKSAVYSLSAGNDITERIYPGKAIEITPARESKYVLRPEAIQNSESRNLINIISAPAIKEDYATMYSDLLK